MEVAYKGKNMDTARHTCNYSQFSKLLIEDPHSFRGHVCRISTQFQQKKYIKHFVPENKVYTDMDFAEKCGADIKKKFSLRTGAQPRPIFELKSQSSKLCVPFK